jgi:hypothetical protein
MRTVPKRTLGGANLRDIAAGSIAEITSLNLFIPTAILGGL